MNRKIENFFSSLDTLHEASVTDYTQNKIVLNTFWSQKVSIKAEPVVQN